MSAAASANEKVGMDFLETRGRRIATVYVPLGVFVFVLLFPFYWMVVTSVKPDHELLSRDGNPFWVKSPTLAHFKKLLFDTAYPEWLWNTVLVSVVSTVFSLVAAVLAAYAIERLRFKGSKQVGLGIFLAYLVPPSILFIPLAAIVTNLGLADTRWALILTYPTFLIPFCTWLLMGYFRSIPFELEECALIDGATRWQILVKIILPLAVPGLISAGIFAFTLSWNEFIYALTFVSSSEIKTLPVGVVTELVEGDVYHWGPLMAGALFGSLPVAFVYAVATLPQGVIALSGRGIMLDGDARPVMDGGLQPPVAGEAADHEALPAALPRHRSNPCQGAQGVIISGLQRLCCLGEQCGEDNPADSRPGAKDCHVALLMALP